MKLIFLVFILFELLIVNCGRTRLYKFNCSSTNQTCHNIHCRLRSISRMNQTLSAGCELQRTVTNPFVSKIHPYLVITKNLIFFYQSSSSIGSISQVQHGVK